MKNFCVYLLFLTAVLISLAEAQRWGSRSNLDKQAARITYVYGASTQGTQPTTSQKVQKMSPGIGAWGYVAIILSVVLSGMGVYYFILFYPIVCKRERMYDVMEMTAV